jgi:chorismate synthase
VLEKFGGDSVTETRRNLQSYLASIPTALRTTDASDASLLAASESDPAHAAHDLAL